ncbi:MAG: hypothetical protein ACYC6A_06675 [Armatimonadota bacterium]
MLFRRLCTITALGLLLCGYSTLAYGAKYSTVFKDREGNTRPLHGEFETQHLSSTMIEGEQRRGNGVSFAFRWDAVEKVLSVRRGMTTISYEQAQGKSTEKQLGAAVEASSAGTLDPMKATYSRKASGEITSVDTTLDGPRVFLMLRGSNPVSPYQLLAYPFGHGLVFPAGEMKDGQTWTQTTVMEMRDNFPVEVSAVFKIEGKQRVGNRDLLQITCTMTGKREPEARDWKDDKDMTISGTYAGTVAGKVVYLFDPAAGVVQRVTAELTCVQEITQPGKTMQLTDRLTTLLEQTPAQGTK